MFEFPATTRFPAAKTTFTHGRCCPNRIGAVVMYAIQQRGEARLEDRLLLSARRQLRRTVRMSSGSFGLSARERRVLQRLALARNVNG
ncbi:hypothetical protein Q3G72_005861 [Acer saccharum]|nr:hypothetical protein Q3G72_005861 [Acer saccharum]